MGLKFDLDKSKLLLHCAIVARELEGNKKRWASLTGNERRKAIEDEFRLKTELWSAMEKLDLRDALVEAVFYALGTEHNPFTLEWKTERAWELYFECAKEERAAEETCHRNLGGLFP